jgi:hypothetical protein
VEAISDRQIAVREGHHDHENDDHDHDMMMFSYLDRIYTAIGSDPSSAALINLGALRA